MTRKNTPEASKSPLSSPTQAMFAQNAINRHPTDVQAPPNHANHDNLPGSHNGVGQDMNARVPYHQPTLATIGASHEPEDFVFVRAAASERRQDVDDDEPSSRSKMWDPVKECSDPNTIQADLPGFLPGGHSYSQAQDNRQQSMNSRTRGTAPIGLPPYPQPHDLAFAYPESALAGSQMFQNGHPYDQFHRNKYLYKDIMISPRRLGDSSGQNGQQSLEPMTGEAALLRIQPQQAGYLHGLFQDNGQQLLGLGSRMPNSLVPHESAHSRPSSPSMSSNISTQRRADSQQAYGLQRQSPSASMSPAKRMGRYAEALDRESNHTEAVRAYEQACALFQEVIIRSCSLEERMECDTARNTYQERLDELSQRSARTSSNKAPERDDRQEDYSPGRGKPQYSLSEDYALCQKEGEDLSWQEVAETAVFKGKRKHRSLSQRKHTIGRMGPRYHEAESPWSEEEDRTLCALGDAGKTLGDIHRKFRSRNAERCLNRYFHLKGYPTTNSHRTRASHQVRQDPPSINLITSHSSTGVARHREYNPHLGTSVVDAVSPNQDISPILPTSGQNIPAVFMPRSETPGMPSSSSPFASLVPMTLNHVDSILPHTPGSQGLSNPSRQQRQAASSPYYSGSVGHAYSTPPTTFNNPSSLETFGNQSIDRLFTQRGQRPATSSLLSSESAAKAPAISTCVTSATNSPTKTFGLPDTHDPSDS